MSACCPPGQHQLLACLLIFTTPVNVRTGNHTTGECWLKYQAEWDNVVDRQSTNLAVNRRGRYPDAFRSEHKTAPGG